MNDYHKISEGILGEETVEKTNTELFLSLVGQYFPEAIKDGEVDFTALKEEMGEFPQVSSEHYEFTWAGKQAAKKEAQADLFGRTLKYKPQDSLNPDTTENIYIEGDNLEALKLLRRNYHGKIKMIYIDPPYNRGDDLIYRDDFTITTEELAELSGYINGDERLQKVSQDDAKYHTKWLNMIYPRLKVARELLADDGYIFISIDDNEIVNLTKLANEVFGAQNYVSTICVETSGGLFGLKAKFANKTIVKTKDYVLVFKKSQLENTLNPLYIPSKKQFDTHFTFYKSGDNECQLNDFLLNNSEIKEKASILGVTPNINNLHQLMSVFPTVKEIIMSEIDHIFRIREYTLKLSTEDLMILRDRKKHLIGGTFVFLDSSDKPQYLYPFSKVVKKADDYFGSYGSCVIQGDFWKGFNEDMGNIGKEGDIKYENGKKPVRLIKNMLKLINDKNCCIMDFFSGSATTAHAVMQMNVEDGGKRNYILVQYPEKTYYIDENNNEIPTKDGKESYKAGFKNICEIGKERIRRAAKKIHEDNPETQFDDGFRVFEVADTNIKWNTVDDNEVLTLADMDSSVPEKDRIDFNKGYTDIDVVYEVMLRQFDIPLSTPIQKLSSVSDRTYIFANAVVVCLEPEIDEHLIERLAAIEPTPAKFVLRDSAFNDDIELKDVSFRRLSALIANHQTEEERKSKYNNYTVEFI